MSEKPSSPGEADNTGQQRPGGRESIVVSPEVLSQAGWTPPATAGTAPGYGDAPAYEPTPAVGSTEAQQVFASTQRKVDPSEAGYNEDPGSSGRLGAILGTILVVLLIGSGITMYEVNKDSGKPASKSDAAKPAATDTPTQDPVPPIKDSAKALPTVAGDFGSKATITVPQDQPDGTFVVKELSAGTGPKVEKGNWVSVDYTAMDWNTGKEIPGSYGDQGGKPQLYQAEAGKLIPALDKAVSGHKAGSRVLVVAPPAAAFGAQGNSQLGIAATDSLVFVLDIRQATAPDAVLSGEMTAPPADMPQVKDNGKKPFDITPVPGVADPTELKSHVLIQGKGRKVETGEKVVVQYTGALYKDGKKFDSSLDRGQAFTFATGAGSVIEGWDKGVVGQNIGSRIELVIPASLAYKDQASNGIPANSTLVFVIDILDAGVGGED